MSSWQHNNAKYTRIFIIIKLALYLINYLNFVRSDRSYLRNSVNNDDSLRTPFRSEEKRLADIFSLFQPKESAQYYQNLQEKHRIMKRIKNKSPPKPADNSSSISNNQHLVTSFFEPAAPTFHEPLTRKRGLYSDDQEHTIKKPKESGDFREELLLSQRSRRRSRYQSL